MENIKSFTRSSLCDERWKHTIGVVQLIQKLADNYNPTDPQTLETVAILHDNARNLPIDKQKTLAQTYRKNLDQIELSVDALLHAPAGAQRIENKVPSADQSEIKHAVAYHSTGSPNLTEILKYLLVADFAEPNRSNEKARMIRRKIGTDPLNNLVTIVLKEKIKYSMSKNILIHPRSVQTLNKLCN